MNKEDQYFLKIAEHINQIFNEDCENYISLEELAEGENFSVFMHVLANITPSIVYSKLSSDRVNALEFNHIANKLCFQFMNKKPSE